MHYTLPQGSFLNVWINQKEEEIMTANVEENERRGLGGILQIGPYCWTPPEAMGHNVTRDYCGQSPMLPRIS